jgi:hypothetical protein
MAAAALVAVACQPVHTSIVAAPPPPGDRDPQLQVNFVMAHLDKLDAVAAALPGDDGRQFCSLMRNDLEEMIPIFQRLGGSYADDAFQERIAVLAACRDQLAAMTDASDSDPTTTTAMLIAAQILHQIAASQPVDDPALFRAVQDCDQVNQSLDDYQGVLHRAAVGRSARQIVAALRIAAADFAKPFAAGARP